MKIKLATSEENIRKAAIVLLQLRPQYLLDDIVAQIKKQQDTGYQLACAIDNVVMVGVAGFVIGEKLAWGKHIYVDDLVTDTEKRNLGIGTKLLDWLCSYGTDNGCQQLHLDSSVTKYSAHRFYLRNGFNIASHHFSMTDLEP